MNFTDIPIEKKIAQMIILGFGGSDLNQHDTIQRDIEELGIGGLVFFDKDMIGNKDVNNIASPVQVQEMIKDAQSKASIPLLISIDQEGGKVARLRKETGFMEFPSAYHLGKVNNEEYTAMVCKNHAQMLQWLGINLNFAPCVDVNVNPDNPIIAKKERSFGELVDVVKQQALIYAKSMIDEGIITCAKHFPGHGSSTVDSHKGLTDITETWVKEELEPYRSLIDAKISPMVMIGHLMLRNIDPELPASLSKKILDELLIKQLNYDGIITTDDLQMRAISDHYTLKETLVLAINAGTDIVVFGNNLLPKYVDAKHLIHTILEAIEEGTLSEERINKSFNKIISLKKSFAIL